jgi:hypothetical protein
VHAHSHGVPTSAELSLRAQGDKHELFRDQTLLVTRRLSSALVGTP